MEDLLYLLAFVFFFVILPMLQRARRKGPVPQPSRRPQRAGGRDSPSVPPSYDEDPSYDDEAIRSSSSPQRAEQRTAEDVLPDDLWQILTGERRPTPRTEPEPQRESPYDEVGADTEPVEPDYEPSYTGDVGAEHERDDRVREWEDVSWEPEPQPIPVPVPLPRPVQLPDPGRHTRARARGAATHGRGAGPRVEAVTSRGSRRLNIALNLDTRDELRRAMILREVLGPPKGLE